MPGTIEDRCTELLTKELQAEIDRGAMRAPLPTRTLAQAIVRVADSFMYAHYLGWNRPEIDQALEGVGFCCARARAARRGPGATPEPTAGNLRGRLNA